MSADRYARQRILPEIGETGQRLLAGSHAVIVGCGALGSVQAQLLARAGVGRLTVIDRDFVERANLQRQILFTDADAEALLKRSCTSCHGIERVNNARFAPDRWRVVTVDMRERGAKLADEELERLVEWLGRTKGTNDSDRQ